jgi:hypothetical protein
MGHFFLFVFLIAFAAMAMGQNLPSLEEKMAEAQSQIGGHPKGA